MTTEIPNWLVIVLGLCIVFIGLICIIIICKILSVIVRKLEKNNDVAPAAESAPAAVVPAATAPIANKQEIVAAVCAAVADDLGTDVSGIKVLSFKRI